MGRKNGRMRRRGRGGASSGTGNNAIVTLSGQFQQVLAVNGQANYVYMNPNALDSQRIVTIAQSFSEFRFTKLKIELLNGGTAATPVTLVVGFSPEIDDVLPTSSDEITELAFSRWNDGGCTIPTFLNVPRRALINQARPWYQCNPPPPANLSVVGAAALWAPGVEGVDLTLYSAVSPYQNACQGAIYWLNSSTTVPQNIIVSYTIQFRDPGTNTAGPPNPFLFKKVSSTALFKVIKSKTSKSDAMDQLMLCYGSDSDTKK